MQPSERTASGLRPGASPAVLRWLWFSLGILLVTSCQHQPLDAGIEPLNAPRRWWNYYRRGLQYSLTGEWQRAALDLEIALGQRRGAPFGKNREQRRVKTYGLHMLDDYFPHRELGICYFHLGQLEAAERELATSLGQVPSSRARYYLNQVRGARLRQGPAAAGPAIRIDHAPESGPLFANRLWLDLSGTLSSPAYVARVRVNGRPLFLELAVPEYLLREGIALAAGEQEVTVEVEDLLGQQSRWSRPVVVDLAGPEIAVARPPGTPAGEVLVVVSDNHVLSAVSINGRALPLAPAQASVSSQVPVRGLEALEVLAVDAAGNRTTLRSAVGELPQANLGRTRGRRQHARMLPSGDRSPVFLAQASTPSGSRADVAPGATALALVPAPVDTQPPVVELWPAVDGPVTVTSDTFVLDLCARDLGGVAAVTFVVNGLQESRVFGPPMAPLRRLTHTVRLRPGLNEVSLLVHDAAGNQQGRALSISFEPSPAWRADLRATAQLLPTFRAAAAAGPTVDLYPPLLSALVRDPARLDVIERDPAIMRRIFAELALSGSSLADARYAIATGKLRPAQYVLVTRGTVWSGQDNFDLFMEMVDTATGEVLLAPDIHFTSADRDHVRSQIECLVAKIVQELPCLTTRVHSCSRGDVLLPVGSSHRVRSGAYVLFLPGGDADPTMAPPLEWEGRWIEGKVTAVEPYHCRVAITPPKGSRRVRPLCFVTFR